MKLAFKTIGLSLLVAILLVTIVISIQLAHVNKIREQNFKDVNERISCKVFDRGYKAYYEDGIVPEDEAYEQFCYYITFLNDAINHSDQNDKSLKKLGIYRANNYYDSDMNSLLKENSLVLVKKDQEDGDNNKKLLFYKCVDDSLSKQIEDVISKFGEDADTLVFEAEGIYYKDYEFIPSKLSFHGFSGKASESETGFIDISGVDKDALEAEGYEYIDMKDEFSLGEGITSLENEYSVMYFSSVDSDKQARVDELIDEAKKIGSDDGRTFIRKRSGLFTFELFSVVEKTLGEKDGYSVVTYDKNNMLFDIMSYKGMGGAGFIFLFLVIIEVAIALLLGLMVGFILYHNLRKKQSNR
ncbi:MAG: hypothetical protein K6F55_06820 [Eubacterium sp.]|nr:hypothetical protein [Eubacterium sp.]